MTAAQQTRSWRAALLVAILILSLVAGTVAFSSTPAAASDSDSCQTTIRHDELRTNPIKIEKLSNGTKVQTTELNTRVYYREDNRFYKVTGNNPNGYCVSFDIRVSREAIPTADLPGKVTSNNGEIEATWRAVADFTRNTTYTRITFTLPANTSATFAPSADRVTALAWASEKKTEGQGLLDSLGSALSFRNKTLEKRHYRINPNETTKRAVPLKNDSTNQRIDEWKALYRTDDSSWRPITQDVEAPVYYKMVDNGDTVQFIFNNASAEVKFIANPGPVDDVRYEWSSYASSWSDVIPEIPSLTFGLLPVLLGGGLREP